MLRHLSTTREEDHDVRGGAASSEQESAPDALTLARECDRTAYAQRKESVKKLARRLASLPTASGVILFEGFWTWLYFNHINQNSNHGPLVFFIFMFAVHLLGISFLNAWLLLWTWIWKYPVNRLIRLKRERAGVDDDEAFKFEP